MPLVVRTFATDELAPYEKNPRQGAVRAIAESLSERGQYRPIVVNEGTLTGRPLEVLAGNHTLAAALALGWASIEATTVDVDDAEAARIVLADNRLADLGSYDDALLAAVLGRAGDLAGTGYEESDLAGLLAMLDMPVELTEPDDVPDLPATPISVAGDIWELGSHRLLVGDAGDMLRVQLVLGARPADVVWTDPPYGVNYVGGTSEALSMQNDDAQGAVAVFARACATMRATARAGAPVYVCHSDVVREEFIQALRSVGITVRQTLVWVKDSLVLSRADYHYRHEPILAAVLPELEDPLERDFENVSYGFTPGGEGRLGRGGKRWYGDNKQTTVFDVPRPKRALEHPTMKPVELVERMLRNSCPPGGVVLDLFAGSGTTMIAAQRLGISAVLVELDPRYADVSCRRFQEFTGIVPRRNGEEVSFT